MSTEQVSGSVLAAPLELPPLQAWLGRLGLSGKILAIGGLVGVVAVFLPLISMSIQLQLPAGAHLAGARGMSNLPGVNSSRSVMVIQDWRGVLCLVGYLAAVALAFVLYPPNGLGQKAIAWAGVGVGGFIALFAVWLLVLVLNGTSALTGFGSSFQISVGIGAILNLLAGAAVMTGGCLKAREEKLL